MENFYPIYMYTPMPEMHNVMVPVTSGCSYQKCLYCDLNFRQKFHVFKLAEIEDYLRKEKIKYDKMSEEARKGLFPCGVLHEDNEHLEYTKAYAKVKEAAQNKTKINFEEIK